MTLSDISIKNPVFAWMLMAGLMLFGFLCFTRMGVAQMPDVDFPVINISINLLNGSPEIMESDVADPVEDAVFGVEGVQDVKTNCNEGVASITVDLDVNRNVDAALQEVQTKVLQAERLMPKDIDPPVITKFNPDANPILWIAVYTDPNIPQKDLMVYVRDHLKDRFTNLPGVANVFLGGWVDRNIRIWVDNQKLNARQLAAQDIVSVIQHEHAEVPAGYIETPQKQYNLRSMGEAYDLNTLTNLPILSRGGAPNYAYTRLKDVASIEDGLATITRISRFNSTPAVGLGIVMQSGSNAVKVATEAVQRLEEIEKELPSGYHVALNFDSTKFIKDNVHELELTIGLAALLTGLVCFVFLGSWTSTVNIFLAIPTSLLGTLMVIYFFGFTLNTFTLLALSLSIGVVVDDAIMVLENIVRHREMGEGQVEAALKGARQVTFAAIATSVAIVAIFLPIAFMQGVIGKFFFQFGMTISTAVLLSLLEAITLTPMRCSQFLELAKDNKFNHAVTTQFSRLSGLYSRVLAWCLNHRWLVVVSALGLFIASLGLTALVKKEFVPYQDQSMVLINYKTLVGSSLAHTDELMKLCESELRKRGEVLNIYTAVGGFQGNAANTAIMFVTLKGKGERPVVEEPLFNQNPAPKGQAASGPVKLVARRLGQDEFSQVIRRDLSKVSPELQISVQDLSMRGWSSSRGYPVELLVEGPDWDKLAQYIQEIQKRMKNSGKLADVDTTYLAGQPEIQVVPNREKAALHMVSMDALGGVVQAMMGGLKVGEYHEGGHQNDIFMRVPVEQRLTAQDLEQLFIRNNRGELVRLSQVADLKDTLSLQSITRYNRQRSINVYANPAPGVTQQIALNEALKVAKEVLPAGYTAEPTGSSATNQQSFVQLLITMILGIVVAYMVLGSQFNSFIHPISILLALPFSITGALLALLVGDKLFGIQSSSLNLYSFIGIILLMGLVKKNSIMLVDFTNQMRAKGLDLKKALLTACPIRLRPILMTSLATVAGALPAALALGPGAELRQPMAIAIIGGIFVSTLLTLVVVPCAYSLMAGLERTKPHSFDTEESNGKKVGKPRLVSAVKSKVLR